MADAKISALTAYTTPISTDVMPIVDVTTSTTKKITIANLGTALATVPTTITVANEATDTTCFPLFVTAATGDLAPKSNATFLFNSNTGLLNITKIAGDTSAGLLIEANNGTDVALLGVGNTANSTYYGAVNFGGNVSPSTNDVGALGTGTTAWADLFLASGGLINFANGDAVITHSTGILTVSTGDLRVTTAGTNSASVVTNAGTQTLTNKRITKRTGTTTSSATPTINTDNVDEYYITAQAADITSFTTNLSGTPTLGQLLFISVIGTAARAITWGASFANGPVALPTTTVTTTQLSVLLKWDGSIWRCYATGSTV